MRQITAYYLNCGYVQQVKIGAEKVELYKEHGAYHVRRLCEYIDRSNWVQECWLVFDDLKSARKAFKRQCDISKAVQS